jgi:hypothetical protein
MGARVGSVRAPTAGVKPYVLVLAALAPLGCGSSASDYSIFQYQTAPYDGGGGSSSGSTPSGEIDATPCVVQGGGAVNGPLAGAALSAKDAIELFDPTEAKFTFLITDYANACSLAGRHAGSNVVSVVYDGPYLSSGTYDVANTPGMSAAYVRYDGSCGASVTEAATSGTVTFDRLDDCGGAGSVDLVLGADHITATFTASVCTAQPGSASCQ